MRCNTVVASRTQDVAGSLGSCGDAEKGKEQSRVHPGVRGASSADWVHWEKKLGTLVTARLQRRIDIFIFSVSVPVRAEMLTDFVSFLLTFS